MGYIHFCNSEARLLLLPRPSLRSREKTGLPQGFSVFSFWGIALSPIHRWTVCWLIERMDTRCLTQRLPINARATLQTTLPVHIQNIFLFHSPSVFPLFHVPWQIKYFANCLSFLPQNTPSAICSIWGSGVGSSDCFDQENTAEVTLWPLPEPGPKTLAVPFSVSRNILSGRPTLLCSMSRYSDIAMLDMP